MKILKMTVITIISIIVLLSAGVYLFFKNAPQIGGTAEGERLKVMMASANYQDGKFQNPVETIMTFPGLGVMFEFFKGGTNREPDSTLTTIPFNKEAFSNDTTENKFSWFGHSSMLISLSGKNLLIDPVFSERASMFSFMGPERYDYTQHVSVDDMPELECVIISHDHYDHLDYETFLKLKGRVQKFVVPLGVGAHLEAWGIPNDQIFELNWWDDIKVDNEIQLTFVPSRHFSGRGLGDRQNTLWGAWVIKSQERSIFFGGDSGYFDGFKEIGEKLGPFDFAMLECGQYNESWPNIHMMPEETAQAGQDLKASAVMPIHWGKFTLSLHGWTEPVERFVKASEDKSYNIVTPKVGEIISLDRMPNHEWWK